MGVFNWLFGGRETSVEDERLKIAIDHVIRCADPRLEFISGARQRLAPAVAHALDFARDAVAMLPPGIEMSPEKWSASPLLRALFATPEDIVTTLSRSEDLQAFMETAESDSIETVHALLGATKLERRVFGSAMEGEILRSDVPKLTVSFTDRRLAGFAGDEVGMRCKLEEFVLEQLVLTTMHVVADTKKHLDKLGTYRRLLQTRLQLLERSGAGLDTRVGSGSCVPADLDLVRTELAANQVQINELQARGSGLEAHVDLLVDAFRDAEAIIRPARLSLRLNAMNTVVGPEVANASELDLVEFSTVNPDRPRRVGLFVSFPRASFVARKLDLNAALRSL